ncbi:MAG: DUF4392 domain-containing protein [Suilimivivens sp.]|nr:DUF4392 domain-containing protein [Lachnospiraceae bacterium]
MTREELAEWNVGTNLDQLMNLDPRGYGVCRILYEGARAFAGEPVSMHSAKALTRLLVPGDIVYIMTGFILRPHKCPETDGIVGAILLARALIRAFDVKPILICPEENMVAVKNCAPLVGMHLYEDLSLALELPEAFGIFSFTKNPDEVKEQVHKLFSYGKPRALISTEAPGANEKGEYHNATGLNMTELEAKMDGLFDAALEKGIPTFAVGDLGNEIGMGAIGSHITRYIPYAGKGKCNCECKGGILARTSADYLITATVSDWGVYALISAIAYLKKDIGIMHDADMEERVLRECARSGMVDMTGSLLPGIDGFDVAMNCHIVTMMRETTAYAIEYNVQKWFEVTLEKGFFQECEQEVAEWKKSAS